MPSPLSISCPKCKSVLKLKDRSKLGKKVACPKCQAPFVLKAPPEPDEDEFDYGIPDEEEIYESEEEPAPPPRRKGGTAKGKAAPKQAAKSTGPNPAILIGAGVLGLLLLCAVGVAGYYLIGSSSPEEQVAGLEEVSPAEPVEPTATVTAPTTKRLDLKYLPAESEFIVQVKVADIWESPVLSDLLANPMLEGFLNSMKENTGMTPSDAESITLASSGLDNKLLTIGGEIPENPFSVVIRTKKPIDIAVLKPEEGATKQVHNGKEYYQFEGDQFAKEGVPTGVYFPEPNVAVFAKVNLIREQLEVNQTAPTQAKFDFVDANYHILIAAVPNDKEAMMKDAPPLDSGMTGAALANTLRSDLQGMCLGINFASGIDFEVALSGADAAAVGRIKAELDKFIAESKTQYAGQKAQIPQEYQFLSDAMVNGIAATATGNIVNVSTALPESVKDSLATLPGAIMMMAMGGMGGGLGGPSEEAFAGDGGESQGATVVAATEGLPEGMQMQASASWAEYGSYAEGLQRPGSLDVVMELSGETAAKVVSYGFVKLSDISTQGDVPLKRVKRSVSQTLEGPHDKFVTVEHDEYSGHPDGKVLVPLAFERPQKPVSQITNLVGTFHLKIAGKTQEILLPNAELALKKPVDNADLKAAGFTTKVMGDDMKYIQVTMGGHVQISHLDVVDAQGNRLEGAGTSFSDYNGPEYTVFFDGGKVPAQFGYKLTLQSEIEEVVVPFAFKDLPVPATPPLEDDVTPFVWTAPTNADEIPEGVLVEGRVRWGNQKEEGPNGQEGPYPLEMVAELHGPLPRMAVAFGFLQMDKATGTGGVELAPYKAEFLMVDTASRMVKLHDEAIFIEHPVEGIQAFFPIKNPGKPLASIEEFEGSLKLMTAEEQRVVVFDKVLSRVGKTLSHPDFKELGLEIKVGKEPPQLLLQLSKGNPAAVESVTAIDGTGNPIPGVSMSVSSGVAYLYFGGDDGIPNDVGLEFKLNFGMEEITVPLKFKDLKVPPVPKEE